MSFVHGVDVTVHRYRTGSRGRQVKDSEHVIEGVGVGRAATTAGEFPVQIDTAARTLMIRDLDADIRSRDYVTFPDGHRLSGTGWQVEGEPLEYESPLTGWRAGMTARVIRADLPEVT